jgi:hypothetical protein
VPRHLAALLIHLKAWKAGDWTPWQNELHNMPHPETALATNGDEVCAEILADRVT